MRMPVLLAASALTIASTLPAAACGWNKTQMTMAEHKPAVPATVATVPAPQEVALRDVWLERLLA